MEKPELNNVRLVKILPDIISGTFRKREFVIATDEEYPQLIKFELHNDKCELLTPFFPGDIITIYFNFRGKEWINPQGVTIYFNSFVAWRIKKIENGYVVPTSSDSPHVQYNFKFPPADEVFGNPMENKIDEYKNQQDDEDNDLPF